tara:strand:- start:2115 stop:2363 length:249 start_codon:yes stop_codon:yes gene_type:complete
MGLQMSRLAEIRDRLENVTVRLEEVALKKSDFETGAPNQEQCVRELGEARAECEQLRLQNKKMAERVGVIIKRLNCILTNDV